MKNKAFTLLELLGVVIILGVLALVTFPLILNQIKNAKDGLKDSTKALIIDAAKDYYEDNTNNFDLIEGMTYCIDIKTLTDENYLNKNLKNENLNNIDTSKKVKLIYHNEKFNYDVVDSCTYYTVIFDANGGNVDTESKEVLENSTYGDLPTPTRAGYTFMGWNGKNMFDEETILMDIPGAIHENECYVFNPQKAHGLYGANGRNKILLNFKENTQYTMSIEASTDSNEILFLGFVYNGESTSSINERITLKSNEIIKSYATSNANKTVNQITISYGYGTANAHVKYIQLEEGDTATEYEPYYITPETKVTRNYDHTLKAIWKENE